MAGTYTVTKQTVFGDLKVVFYDVTNWTADETLSIPGMRQIYHFSCTPTAASQSVGGTVSGAVITFKCAANSYDGKMVVYGR